MFLIKTITSALLIATVTEIAKRSSFWAAVLISLPLISILSFIWIYIEAKDVKQIHDLSWEVFYLVIPSLLFFVALPLAIKAGFNFWVSLIMAVILTSIAYWITTKVISWV